MRGLLRLRERGLAVGTTPTITDYDCCTFPERSVP